jgi:hypothetical protein
MMRPRLFYEKSRIHDVSWGLILFEGWDMLRRCEAILAWHMRREILCFSGQYLAMAQIRHSEPKQELWTKMHENEREWKKTREGNTARRYEAMLVNSLHIFPLWCPTLSLRCVKGNIPWNGLGCTWPGIVLYGSIMFYMVLMSLLMSCHTLRVF